MAETLTAAQAVGRRIASLRRERGESQVGLAFALGLTPTTVFRWESGRSVPTARSLQKLGDHFGIPVSALLPGDDGYFN